MNSAFVTPLPITHRARALAHTCPHPQSPRVTPRAALATPSPPVHPNNESAEHPSSPALPIKGRLDLENLLLSTAPDKLVVVLFHARWCRVCKTLAAKLPRVALDFPSLIWRTVDFAELENKPLCAELEVKLLPTFRFYRGGSDVTKKLDQFTTGPFGVQRLIERLEEQRHTGLLDYTL